jgi:hypothetical protein
MGFPLVNVLSMEDGACTVIRPWPLRRQADLAIIDCGAYKASPLEAARRLWNSLGRTLAQVGTITVSHFDADHWDGLASLHKLPGMTRSLGSCTLYYPAMPYAVDVYFMAMVGLSTGSGIAALELKAALEPLLVRGAKLTMRPLTSAIGTIEMARDTFDVLWPPSTMGPDLSRQLHGAIAAVEKLAGDLAESGHPILRQRIKEALRVIDGSSDTVLSEGRLDLSVEHDEREDDSSNDIEDEHHEDTFDPPPGLDIPDEKLLDYSKVMRRIRRANNNLSLVLASKAGHFVGFGDIGGLALDEVLTTLTGRDFRVTLAPHHGTHKLKRGMPNTLWCVVQDGPHHDAGRRRNHSHSGGQMCWSTSTMGEFPPWAGVLGIY